MPPMNVRPGTLDEGNGTGVPLGTKPRSLSGTLTLTYTCATCEICKIGWFGEAKPPGSSTRCVITPSNGATSDVCAICVCNSLTCACADLYVARAPAICWF